MADEPSYPDSGDDTGAGTPRWVKVSAIVALALLLVVVILLLTGIGNHGPSRHASGGGAGPQTVSSVTENTA